MYEPHYAAAYTRSVEAVEQQIATVQEIFDDTADPYWAMRLEELAELKARLEEERTEYEDVP